MEQNTRPELALGAASGDTQVATDSTATVQAWIALESQVRECFGRVVYSHKTHEKCADIALSRLATIKVSQIVLSAVTTGGLLAVLLGPADKSKVAAGIAAVVSTVLLALNAYTKESDLGQRAQKHKDAADKLWSIRESYLSLLTDAAARLVSVTQIRERRDALQVALGAAYEAAPRTSNAGYERAQMGLQQKEDLTFTDDEIDKFLPTPLRRGGSSK